MYILYFAFCARIYVYFITIFKMGIYKNLIYVYNAFTK